MSDEYGPDAVNGHDSVAGLASVPTQRSGTTDASSGEVTSAQAPGAVPAATAGPAPLPASPLATRRKGRILVVLAIVLASLVLVGGIAGIVVYDQVTKIDRSSPTVVVRQFLQAALVDKDATQVGLFVCRDWPSAQAMSETDPHLDSAVTVAWGVTSEQVEGSKAQVAVRMTFSLTEGGVSQRSVEAWTLDLVREDGWRACALKRGTSLSP